MFTEPAGRECVWRLERESIELWQLDLQKKYLMFCGNTYIERQKGTSQDELYYAKHTVSVLYLFAVLRDRRDLFLFFLLECQNCGA